MDPALPTRAAALLLQAQHVYIFAPDASCGLASIFCYMQGDWGFNLFC